MPRDYLKELQAIDNDFAMIQARKREILEEYAQFSPHKIGDTVKITGYAYCGKEMRVTDVRVVLRFGRYNWKIVGNVINKDGKPGNIGTAFHLQINDKGR